MVGNYFGINGNYFGMVGNYLGMVVMFVYFFQPTFAAVFERLIQ